MEYTKVLLHSGDSVGDIITCIEKIQTQKIVFLCPRNLSLLTDMSFLKRIKTIASEQKKKIVFVSPQKFIRDILKSQKFRVHSQVTKEFEEGEEKTLRDIFPHTEAKKNPSPEEKKEKTSAVAAIPEKPQFQTHKIENIGSEKSVRGKIFFGFLAVILILAGLWAWVSPKAQIVIKPTISVVPVNQNILVTLPDSTVPDENKNLPQVKGIFVQTEVAGTEVFPASGRRYDLTNARGKVTLFNETSRPKFFIPSRLSTKDGIIFRFEEDVTVPARTEEGPGRMVVDVVADEYDENGDPIGERGNIDAGTDLFFPALSSVSQELYYARANKGPLVGGSTLTHYFVQEEDFERIQDVLIETFRVRGTEYLRNEIISRSEREGKQYILMDDPRMLQHEILEIQFPEDLVGEEVQTFEVSGKLKLSGIVFDQSEVADFLAEKLRQTQDHRKILVTIDDKSASYRVLEAEELPEQRWVKLSVEMQGVEMLDIDSDTQEAQAWRESIKKEIAGKSLQQARSILTNYPEIEHILDIRISPFWVEDLPDIFNQIDFRIQTETEETS